MPTAQVEPGNGSEHDKSSSSKGVNRAREAQASRRNRGPPSMGTVVPAGKSSRGAERMSGPNSKSALEERRARTKKEKSDDSNLVPMKGSGRTKSLWWPLRVLCFLLLVLVGFLSFLTLWFFLLYEVSDLSVEPHGMALETSDENLLLTVKHILQVNSPFPLVSSELSQCSCEVKARHWIQRVNHTERVIYRERLSTHLFSFEMLGGIPEQPDRDLRIPHGRLQLGQWHALIVAPNRLL